MQTIESQKSLPDAKDKELLSYEDVAEILGVTKRTIQTYVNHSWLRPIAITGRTKRIRRSDLNRFLEQAEAGKLTPADSRPIAQMSIPF